MKKILLLIAFKSFLLCSSCLDNPSDNKLNGMDYQGKASDDNSCKTMSNDSGDGLGYLFANPNLDKTCAGFCYFNLPDSSGGNTNPPATGDEDSIADLIPYLDEVEAKNEAINNSLNTLNSNLNTQFAQINSNTTTLNTTLEKIDETLQAIKDGNSSGGDNGSGDDGNNDDELDGIADNFTINPDISSELGVFKNQIESNISSSFSSYSDVFGFSGYGSAPAPIALNVLGKSFILFDIKYLNPYIEHIRDIFVISAYILGLFLFFRGD